jgi:hypothetical protein
MPSKEECDRYAAELNRKFEELTAWAIANWPKKDFPLLKSDFSQSRREIANIMGPKLGDGDTQDHGPGAGRRRGDAPFVDMNPMPWP